MQINRTNYLITGATGFLGSNIIKKINNNFFKGKIYYTYREKKLILKKKNLIPIKLDFSIDSDLSKIKTFLSKIDVVIHCANLAHGKYKLELLRDINYNATLRLAIICKIFSVKKFIFLSTAKINMNYQNTYNNESSYKNNYSDDIYSKIKLETEEKLKKIFNFSNTKLYLLRPALIYGKNVKGNLKKLHKIVQLNLPLPFGLAKNKKTFCSIDNILNLIIEISLMDFKSGSFIVCDNFRYSLKEIICEISKKMGKKEKIFKINLNILKFLFYLLGKKEIYLSMFSEMKLLNCKLKRYSRVNYNKNLSNTKFL